MRNWFQQLASDEVDALNRHVRLVYPYASTETTVRATFERASQGVPALNPPTARSWLRRLAREIALAGIAQDNRWRDRNAQMIQMDFRDVADGVLEPDARAAALELADRLGELAPEDLEILRMTVIEQLGHDELAHVLNVSVTDAEHRLVAAQARLRMLMSPEAEDH